MKKKIVLTHNDFFELHTVTTSDTFKKHAEMPEEELRNINIHYESVHKFYKEAPKRKEELCTLYREYYYALLPWFEEAKESIDSKFHSFCEECRNGNFYYEQELYKLLEKYIALDEETYTPSLKVELKDLDSWEVGRVFKNIHKDIDESIEKAFVIPGITIDASRKQNLKIKLREAIHGNIMNICQGIAGEIYIGGAHLFSERKIDKETLDVFYTVYCKEATCRETFLVNIKDLFSDNFCAYCEICREKKIFKEEIDEKE